EVLQARGRLTRNGDFTTLGSRWLGREQVPGQSGQASVQRPQEKSLRHDAASDTVRVVAASPHPLPGTRTFHSCPHDLQRYFVSTAASWSSVGSTFFRPLKR